MTLETHSIGGTMKFGVEKRPARNGLQRKWRVGRSSDKNVQQRGFGLVEKMFYYYKRIKSAVEEVRAEQGYYQSGGKTGGGSSNHAFISDPTAMAAMRRYAPIPKVIINAERLDEDVVSQPEKWMVVVEQTLLFFEDDFQIAEVLRRRFLDNESMPRTCTELGITKDRYYRLRDIGITYARECALQLGLLKVFKCDLPMDEDDLE